jgi:tetratricopeptide (TPR) repeat protein
VSEAVYERYKDALRRGHVASLRGRHDEAIDAYREAAAIAPERVVPHTSLGGVLLREGRADEALAAYEAALERAEDDESAAEGRRQALTALGLPPDTPLHPEPEREPEPQPPAVPAALPGDGTRLALDAQKHLDRGDHAAARERWLAAAVAHRSLGEVDAALDACYLALGSAPADVGLHITLADLYLDRGWRSVARDKLVLLARVVELDGDATGRDEICRLVSARLADDAELGAICR